MLNRSRMSYTHLGVISILGCCVGLVEASPAIAQNTRLLGTAHTAHVISDVVFNKDRKYLSAPIPTATLYRTGLFKVFREVESNPEIVVKFHKDVFTIDSETVSITVFDADDNSVIYSEERKLVDEMNDVDRLVSHFLAKVKIERDAIAQNVAEERRVRTGTAETRTPDPAQKDWEERDRKSLDNADQTLSVYSSSDVLITTLLQANRSNPINCHVYISEAKEIQSADVVLVEEFDKGQHFLVLRARDTHDMLHKVTEPTKSVKRAVYSMELWINSQDWK